MSLCRRIRRAANRRSGEPWPAQPQPIKMLKEGGYRTLRPTKGWIKVSGKRVRAGLALERRA